jgi:hypothetical protein
MVKRCCACHWRSLRACYSWKRCAGCVCAGSTQLALCSATIWATLRSSRLSRASCRIVLHACTCSWVLLHLVLLLGAHCSTSVCLRDMRTQLEMMLCIGDCDVAFAACCSSFKAYVAAEWHVKQVSAHQQKNMQRHPTPGCKAAHVQGACVPAE